MSLLEKLHESGSPVRKTSHDEDFRHFLQSFLEQGSHGFMPRVDLQDYAGQLTLTVELPGVSIDDVTVDVTADAISIRGHKRPEPEIDGETWHRTERSYGVFRRVVALPAAVDRETSRARFRDGVLRITVRKDPDVRHDTHTVSVTAE